MGPQIRKVEHADIVVGTPGRILDHIEKRTLNLSKLKTLVLDEADRMVDMGFLPDVEKIINSCPKERQTLLFSATISQDINYISKKYMKSPVFVGVETYVDASKLKQIYYDIPLNQKFSLLVHLLKKERPGLVMVFCNTRRNADIVTRNLFRYGLKAVAIHGGLEQNRRSNIMKEFHAQSIGILVCTDVAARGLDIKNVSHIYNYDLPMNSADYIHRIGRTARAGKEGEAISLVSNRDYENFGKIKMDDSLKINDEKLPEFEQLTPNFSKEADERRGSGGGGRFGGNRSFGGRSGGSGGRFGGGSRGGSSGPRRFGGNREGSSRGGGRFGGSRDGGSSGSGRFGGERRGGERRSFGGRRFSR